MTTPKKLTEEELEQMSEHIKQVNAYFKYASVMKLLSHIAALEEQISTQGRGIIDAAHRLSVAEKERDSLKQQLEGVFDFCQVIYFFSDPIAYPIEHNPYAKKDSKEMILNAITKRQSQ